MELANRETGSSWKAFLTGLRERGLSGVEFIVSDAHDAIQMALRSIEVESSPFKSAMFPVYA